MQHPRAFLRASVAACCAIDPETRREYGQQSGREFFDEKDASKDPIRALAEFLDWFAVEDGAWNGFLSPLSIVKSLLEEYGVGHDLPTTLQAIKKLLDAGEASADTIETCIRDSLPRT